MNWQRLLISAATNMNTPQTRLGSAIEVAVNYIIGYVLAFFIQKYFLKWMGYPAPNKAVGTITLIFTIVSIIRSYVVRRFFNWCHSTE